MTRMRVPELAVCQFGHSSITRLCASSMSMLTRARSASVSGRQRASRSPGVAHGSISGRCFLDEGEAVGEHVPGVDGLKAQSHLVLALEISLSVRVAELDQLDGQLALDTPADTVREVADDRAYLGVGRLGGRGNGVALSDRDAEELGDVRAEAQLRVTLIGGVARAVLTAQLRERPGELRVEGSARDHRRVRAVHDLTDSSAEGDVGLSGLALHFDDLRRRGSEVRPRRDLHARQRVNRVVEAEVKSARQCLSAGLCQLVEDAELVVLISPHDLLRETHSDLRLVGRDRHGRERARGRCLIGALLDELRLRQVVEHDDVLLAEAHRLLLREQSDSRQGLRLLDHAVRNLAGQQHGRIGCVENSHSWLLPRNERLFRAEKLLRESAASRISVGDTRGCPLRRDHRHRRPRLQRRRERGGVCGQFVLSRAAQQVGGDSDFLCDVIADLVERRLSVDLREARLGFGELARCGLEVVIVGELFALASQSRADDLVQFLLRRDRREGVTASGRGRGLGIGRFRCGGFGGVGVGVGGVHGVSWCPYLCGARRRSWFRDLPLA
ncbi:hypothetical protein HMPREF1505_1743 [Prevotella sp. ICM33]|nr:hypothetical protein HMPREF1505_1743 [Prevotella sp. ICM33]